MSNNSRFRWPTQVWTISSAGDTYSYLFKEVGGDIATYHSTEFLGVHVFCEEDFGKKFFLSELEAFAWLEKQVFEYLLMVRQKKQDAQNRIARP